MALKSVKIDGRIMHIP